MNRVPILCVFALLFVPNGAWAQGEPLGPEFRVNTYTTNEQSDPAVASDSSGNFVVVWESRDQDAPQSVFGQRYASTGEPLGPEFRVNTYTGFQNYPAVASDASGNFVVVWTSAFQDGAVEGVFGQRYDSTGAPLGPEFRVNKFTAFSQDKAAVASDPSGKFVVVWESSEQDGSYDGVFRRRCCSSTGALGPDLRVNTFTTNSQGHPAVASDSSGNFVVIWAGQGVGDGSGGVFGRLFASSGAPLGPEFRVNTYTTGAEFEPAVAADAFGNFVVVWTSLHPGLLVHEVFGQRYSAIAPVE
jgi:hypothetical protein